MAIYSQVPPHHEAAPANTTVATEASNTAAPNTSNGAAAVHHSPVDIDAWTISALQSLAVSPVARGTGGTSLSIPIDDTPTPSIKTAKPSTTARIATIQDGTTAPTTTTTTTPPLRRPRTPRDSMRHRDALLKGNEGSRQRRRWDMARLTDVPNVQPPLPADWEPRPLWTVAHVPYQVAQYWDYGLRERVEARSGRKQRMTGGGGGGGGGRQMTSTSTSSSSAAAVPTEIGRVPRELRDTCKKAPGIKGYVRDLEEPVRRFLVEQRGARARVRDQDKFVKVDNANEADTETEDSALSSEEDEEIVFVGRGGRMRDGKMDKAEKDRMMAQQRQQQQQQGDDGNTNSNHSTGGGGGGGGWKKAHRELRDQPVDRGMVYDALDDGESGRFKRWLTHSISMYYGLVSKSVMAGTPARRCVYVGVRDADVSRHMEQLPRPLCELL